MSELGEVRIGLTRVPFAIHRSARRATVSLAVDPTGDLTVTAPPGVSEDRLVAIVRAKAPWVLERVRRASSRPPPPPAREMVSGETVRYLGRHYRLRVVRGADAPAALHGAWLVVTTQSGSAAVRDALVDWLRRRAERYLPARLRTLCERLRVDAPPLRLADQRGRWGSCDASGTLRINWRIVQAPVSLVDYVLVHELTHVRWPSHGPAFWSALGVWMPDYELRRDRLKAIGADLVW